MDYTKLTDEKLCELAKDGDKAASNELAKRYNYAVTFIARSYYLVGGEESDLLQEGNMGLVSAINNYEGKVPFKNFAYTCIKNAILSAIRKSNTSKNSPLNNYISLSGDGENDSDKTDLLFDASVQDPLQSIINTESFNDLTKSISDSLSGYENKVLSLYVKGYSYEYICKTLNKDSKSVDNALQRIKKKITLLTAK